MRAWSSRLLALAAIGASIAVTPTAMAQKHLPQNLQQMVTASSSIIAGEVLSVTDGFDGRNRPYTEVTIRVSMDAKGKFEQGSVYTFRQFGLLKPRSMGNGKVYLGVSPEGFAKWHAGEQVVAFMNPDFGGGLRSTVGLEQGKFNVTNGKVANDLGNSGLFDNMNNVDLADEDRSMMTNPTAVELSSFMGLVVKLVEAK